MNLASGSPSVAWGIWLSTSWGVTEVKWANSWKGLTKLNTGHNISSEQMLAVALLFSGCAWSVSSTVHLL